MWLGPTSIEPNDGADAVRVGSAPTRCRRAIGWLGKECLFKGCLFKGCLFKGCLFKLLAR